MARYFISILALIILHSSYCQEITDRDFSLIYISENVSYDAKKLSDEIAKQKSLDAVKKFVAKNIQDKDSKIVVSFKRNNDIWRWERKIGTSEDGQTHEWIIFGKRGFDNLTINRPNEFNRALSDTLIITDTFLVNVSFDNSQWDISKYQLHIFSADSVTIRKIPVSKLRQLIFTKDMLPAKSEAGKYYHVDLFNAGNPSVILGDFFLYFPTKQVLKEWIAVARAIKEKIPASSMDEITEYLQEYITDQYASINFSMLKLWLSNHL